MAQALTRAVQRTVEDLRALDPDFDYSGSAVDGSESSELAYLAGVCDRYHGKRANPFTRGTKLFDAWDRGWIEVSKRSLSRARKLLQARKDKRRASCPEPEQDSRSAE